MIQIISEESDVFKEIKNNDGDIIAIGGSINEKRIIEAYKKGIFPWYNEEDEKPIWWSPRVRCVLIPDEFKVSKSFKKFLRQHNYKVTLNKDFKNTINHCRKIKRKDEEGTWINNEIETTYTKLNKIGITHSIEVWNSKGNLVGGLYGAFINNIFFGESMFSKETNTSKLAFYYLARFMRYKGYKLIDCQVTNQHLISLGAKEMKREDFLGILKYN